MNGVVVGNETIFAGLLEPIDCEKLTADEDGILKKAVTTDEVKKAKQQIAVNRLIKLIQRAKKSSPVPVTTGEIWSVWRDHPELVSAVDYIAVHILPYWEGVSDKAAVDAAHRRLRPAAPSLSRQAHRHRRVRLAERRL